MSGQAKKTGLDLMRAPFPEHHISTMCRSTKKDNQKGKCQKCGGYHGLPAIQLEYVGHAALTDRLLEADPEWTWEPLATGPDGYPVIDKDGGMWIKLTVCGVTRLGYGDAQGKTGGDAMKERIGDALRNAAMRFGAALDLWHKGDLHKEEDETHPGKADTEGQQYRDFLLYMEESPDINTLTTRYKEAMEWARKVKNIQFAGSFKAAATEIGEKLKQAA
jgi:hypothetical protein